MTKIGIIVNPYANSVKNSRRDLAELFKIIGGEYVDVRLTKKYDDIDKIIKDFKKKRILYEHLF